MDEDRIGLVLARTSELRSKIINCIHKASANVEKGVKENDNPDAESQENEDEETECLLDIRDALESLEAQLSSLQALQQQQWYEKEAALTEIEYSQKKLLKELKEYKGTNLDVIHEAISFASETEESNDLLLPPYPRRPSHSLVSDNGHLSSFLSTHKFSQNESIRGRPRDIYKSERTQTPNESRSLLKGASVLVGTAAKAALTIIGVISILNLAGFEPSVRKRGNHFRILDIFQLRRNNDEDTAVKCPPGKVPVLENGEMRCVVKERVEIPFESSVSIPDVNYGCG
ncbi:plastid division PDV2 [Olea europaea subsp. europaea]|uniref:Plastid division PDV2 n=1 Tax=Olea europaea subsp. europaea TaxID=158383 RepID=A0A8S0TJX5_OLEEU|nr:plastid division PDV2 [Olea europaea subsp. europaea]